MNARFLSRHETLTVALLATAVAASILAAGGMPARHYSLEARQRAAVAADVISGVSRGTEGLVGSLYLAPLPTVLVIFAGLLPLVAVTPALGAVVAAAATVLLAAYANTSWRRHGVTGALRYPAMLCLLLLPPVALSMQSGQSVMVFVALVVCGAGELVGWLRSPSVRHLALSAVLLGAAVVTRYQGLLFVLVAAALVALAAVARRQGRAFVEGTLITFLFPTTYMILLWIGGNWLILGSPLFFLKAVWGPPSFGAAGLRALLAWDCPWLLLGVLAAFVLSVPLAACLTRPGGHGLPQQVAAGAAITALCVLALRVEIPTGLQSAPSDQRQVVRLLESAYPNGTFIVTGYAGYGFVAAAHPDPERRWVHIMHLEPGGVAKVLADYTGRGVYLLVNAAETRDRWDEVGLGWHRPGSRIPERYLFARQVGEWTVFEVLRAQE